MMRYILDSNSLISSKNQYYDFDVYPGFWNFVDLALQKKIFVLIEPVFNELTRGDDELSMWIKSRKDLVIDAYTKEVQKKYAKVVEHVTSHPKRWSKDVEAFAGGADPWLIAYLLVHSENHSLVTFEFLDLQDNCKTPKIPAVCRAFDCEQTMTLFEALREIKPIFDLRPASF